MFGKPEWFTTSSCCGGVSPVTFKGWLYLAVWGALIVLETSAGRRHQPAYRAAEVNDRAIVMFLQSGDRCPRKIGCQERVPRTKRFGMAVPLHHESARTSAGRIVE